MTCLTCIQHQAHRASLTSAGGEDGATSKQFIFSPSAPSSQAPAPSRFTLSDEIKCETHQNCFLASDKTLAIILKSILKDRNVKLKKIELCDKGGWHISVELVRRGR